MFSRGTQPFEVEVVPEDDCLMASTTTTKVDLQIRVELSVDRAAAPQGRSIAAVEVRGAGDTVRVEVPVFNPAPDPVYN